MIEELDCYVCLMLPKMSACRRDFDETKYISFCDKR